MILFAKITIIHLQVTYLTKVLMEIKERGKRRKGKEEINISGQN